MEFVQCIIVEDAAHASIDCRCTEHCFHSHTSKSPAPPTFPRPSQRRTDKDVWAAAAARRQRSDADELGALEALAAAESRSKQTDKGPRCVWEECFGCYEYLGIPVGGAGQGASSACPVSHSQ